ncbi:branched-chain amino acid ABC transporter permease [Teichococcus cervicalis]|uniref:Branched-chain amino acid ABC transporter, permease protein n=1 Tax=Pseudoroseomonas cervicalis ATCC 49957 TaxID=525371 RepID=D5RGA1_9PROT|nr:branched-chain amino acid ABC transporter permease [Pseudoroseomonas cervicalis]EFH13671.1 branched-chain amino acid ABC transporter, permease protein [Pseudoroseomonas cervicalis ATCC 49957]
MSDTTLPAPAYQAPRRPRRLGHAGFWLASMAFGALVILALGALGSEYAYFAATFVLQYVVLATAWNILGGYAGYVNFGAAAFFAAGAYTTVAAGKAMGLGLLPCIGLAALVGGALGFGTGLLTLRLRGAYFAIATLCLAVVLQTAVTNWNYVGGSRGAYVLRPREVPFGFESYGAFLCAVAVVLAVAAVALARSIETSRLGLGLAALRDDEAAAEAAGVPTLRLKLIATSISGAMMAVAGAPLPYLGSYVEPNSAFGLAYAVNAIAMPLIGGTASWAGPLIGAVLLASLQQAATVTISSAVNLMIVGVVLVLFVCLAPHGIIGLFRRRA